MFHPTVLVEPVKPSQREDHEEITVFFFFCHTTVFLKMLSFENLAEKIAACQRHFEFENAQFLAERLHAQANSVDSLHTLATAYFQNGNKLQAWSLLRNASVSSRKQGRIAFLLSKCCFDLRKFREAKKALLFGWPGAKSADPHSAVSSESAASSFSLPTRELVYDESVILNRVVNALSQQVGGSTNCNNEKRKTK